MIIAGTHGYEKGGPLTAIDFLENHAEQYVHDYNIVVYPCICPGPYEKELRFTENRVDPNRDALLENPNSAEMRAFTKSIKDLHGQLSVSYTHLTLPTTSRV